jgi:hypothetical protein
MKEKEKEKESEETKEEKKSFFDSFFISCIFVTIILIPFMVFAINDFNDNIKKHNLNYQWPKLSDLIPSIFILPLIMAYKTIIEYLSKGFSESCLAKKYKEAKTEKMKKLANIYRHKLPRHIYKITFYVGITIYGYYVLRNLPYFPKSMLGNGYMPKMFLKGFPDSYFHERSSLFILYYNISLAYFVNDFIFLFIMDRQSDFIKMLLHHICTISLIIFSYVTNYSNIGSLVIFCHMQSDILLHVTRFLLQTDNPVPIVGFIGIVFTINFVYMRQFVFGDMIYTIYRYITWKWGIITTTLWLFLVMLYILHLHWSYILLSKTMELLKTKKGIIDDVNYDKLIKNNKNKNVDVKKKVQ